MPASSVLHLPLGRWAGGQSVAGREHSDPPALQNAEICKIQKAIWTNTCSSALPFTTANETLTPFLLHP